jgi:hypothetical protein
VASWAQLAVAQDLAADDFRIFDSRFKSPVEDEVDTSRQSVFQAKETSSFFVKITGGHFC